MSVNDSTMDHNPAVLSEALQQALASLRLEGIVLSKETINDLIRVDAGQLSKDEALNRVLARVNS